MTRMRAVLAGVVLVGVLGAVALRTCAANPPHERAADVNAKGASPAPESAPVAARPGRARTEEPAPVAESVKPADTGAIVGVALRTDGKPAAGAKVRAAPGGDYAKAAIVFAGPDGSFRFPALAPGSWKVVCSGGGYGTRLDHGAEASVVELVAGAEVRVEVRGEALATVTGHVAGPDGKPVKDVRVQAQCDAFLYQGGCWRLDAKTDADGAYEFTNVTPGDFVWLFFTADGLAAEDRKLHDVASGSRTVVDVAMQAAASLELLLVAADDGTPVGEAIVWISDAESGFLYDGGHGDAFDPDAGGRVRAAVLRPKPVAIQIDAKGFVSVPRTTVDPRTQQGPLTIRLTRAMSISGRLVRADGTAVAGEWLRAFPASNNGPLAFSESACQGESGQDGAFRIDGLRAGRMRVGLWSSTGEEIVATEADAGATDVVLTFAGDGAVHHVRVRVVGPDGQPVPKVRIRSGRMFHGSPTYYGGGGIPSKPEEDVEVAPNHDAFVEAWDARDARSNRLPLGHVFAVLPRDAKDVWSVTMLPEHAVEGRVLGPDGDAVEGAAVAVETVPGQGLDATMSLKLVGTSSGARGAFRVVGLGDERVWLTASAEGLVGTSVEAAADATDVTLRLARGADAAIRVVDFNGKPVAEAGVMAVPARTAGERPSESYVTAMTDADGRARLRGLVGGRRYRLSVSVPGTRRDLYSYEENDWAPRDTEIRLGRAYAIEGVVKGAAGESVGVFEHVVEVSRGGEPISSAPVVQEGRFRAIVKEPGRYTLRILGDENAVLATAEAEADGEPVTLELRAK